ncbi:MAG TPA: selenocysteine-specific translation elongation factor, partial [Chthonomonadaceae bacterium]|nr:selenocysteine-specific translation elongation factor [Chthonomonadaceae bacterium]
MKHVIIGTAGHVDHGKTTLIQALTGTNPDRLKEEQERGMTIDIGFAALKLPDGTVAGIVDVPGHERFLKNMLAGVSGVDVVLLVIASDESVMPQTREHLDILRLLDVKNGVVALTKMDLVDKEWTDVVEEDVRAQLAGSFLAGAPIIRVSAATGKGLDALKRALMSAVSRSEARNAALPFRLPVDRVFTRPGFGTVVTGTLVAGTLKIGDAIEIVPQKILTRVRGLQIHGHKESIAEAGSRVAVNIAGVETEAIARGAQLSAPGTITPTSTFDAVIRLLPNLENPLKDRARIRLHLGTAEILGRVRLLDEKTELEPGGRAFVQFRGEELFACARGDRFVVRAYSPMSTIGGGTVLDPSPGRHRKADKATLEALAAKERGTPEDVLATLLQGSPLGIARKELALQSRISPSEVETTIAHMLASGLAISPTPDRLFHPTVLNMLTDRAHAALEAYHSQFPLRPGMPKEELRAALGREVDPRVLSTLLTHWQNTNQVSAEGATVRLSSFQVELNERQQSLLQRIEAFYVECGIAVPTVEEVCGAVKAPPDAVNALLRVGVDRGRFQRVAD